MKELNPELLDAITYIITAIVGYIARMIQAWGKQKDLKEIITKQHQTIKDITQIQNKR